MKKIFAFVFICSLFAASFAFAASPPDLNPKDFTVFEGYKIIFVENESAKVLSAECECTVYIDEKSKTIFLLFIPQDMKI